MPFVVIILWIFVSSARQTKPLLHAKNVQLLGECVIMRSISTAFLDGSKHVKSVLLTIESGNFKSTVDENNANKLNFNFASFIFNWSLYFIGIGLFLEE